MLSSLQLFDESRLRARHLPAALEGLFTVYSDTGSRTRQDRRGRRYRPTHPLMSLAIHTGDECPEGDDQYMGFERQSKRVGNFRQMYLSKVNFKGVLGNEGVPRHDAALRAAHSLTKTMRRGTGGIFYFFKLRSNLSSQRRR